MKLRTMLIAALIVGGFVFYTNRPNSALLHAFQKDNGSLWSGPSVARSAGLGSDEVNNIDVYKNAKESVVYVTSTVYQTTFFFEQVPTKEMGSGFLVNADGQILTNNHVISGSSQVEVTLPDQSRYKAQILLRDRNNDLALIKIDPKKRQPFLNLGDSDRLQVGQKVMAIGNPFGFLQGTLTVGVVSSLSRTIQNENGQPLEGMIQTDAAINSGNSGGPLLDSQGNVIGINTAIYGPNGTNVGIGFAIPINRAKAILDDFRAGRKPARLGVTTSFVGGRSGRGSATADERRPAGAASSARLGRGARRSSRCERRGTGGQFSARHRRGFDHRDRRQARRGTGCRDSNSRAQARGRHDGPQDLSGRKDPRCERDAERSRRGTLLASATHDGGPNSNCRSPGNQPRRRDAQFHGHKACAGWFLPLRCPALVSRCNSAFLAAPPAVGLPGSRPIFPGPYPRVAQHGLGRAPLAPKKGLSWTLAFACTVAGTAFLYLALTSPPWNFWWRVGGMAVVGLGAGLLHTAIFEAISPMYRHDPVATLNLAGMLFGLGCLTVALLISGIYYMYTPAAIQVWIAVIPALAGWGYWKTQFPATAVARPPTFNAILSELKTPAAVLLSLLLFFQLGNEWAIAGWLPLFLSQRLGMSPESSILMLALYWLALLVGRALAQWMLPRVRHSRALIASVVAAIVGCTILLFTDNRFGAVAGILLLGGSFAPIYPLVVEKIGSRFPDYHPGRYNGLFSIAMACGLLAPFTLGFFASIWGVGVVMGLPLAGSIVVFALLVLIWMEARFAGASTNASLKPVS